MLCACVFVGSCFAMDKENVVVPSRQEMLPILKKAADNMQCALCFCAAIKYGALNGGLLDSARKLAALQYRHEKLKHALVGCLCVNCGKKADCRCSGCHIASYCSNGCQKSDWAKTHGIECKIFKEAPKFKDFDFGAGFLNYLHS